MAPARAAASAARWTRRELAQYHETSTTIATIPIRAISAPAKMTRTCPFRRRDRGRSVVVGSGDVEAGMAVPASVRWVERHDGLVGHLERCRAGWAEELL